MGKYAGLWVDHRKAFIVFLNKGADAIEPEKAETTITIDSEVEKHVRLSGGSGSRKTPYGPQDISVDSKIDDRRRHQLQEYYQEIIRTVRDARKLLIFGPGEAKGELEKEIKKSKSLAAKVLPLETTDKMTEKQIAAKVRKFFASYN
jgi:hypothetical protein